MSKPKREIRDCYRTRQQIIGRLQEDGTVKILAVIVLREKC